MYISCTTLVLFCSLAVLDPRVGHTMDVLSPFILIDSYTESPSMSCLDHAVRDLPIYIKILVKTIIFSNLTGTLLYVTPSKLHQDD